MSSPSFFERTLAFNSHRNLSYLMENDFNNLENYIINNFVIECINRRN